MAKMFEIRARATDKDENHFVTLSDDAPEWLRDAVQEAHGGALPRDWIYEQCKDAYEAESDLTDYDELHEYADAAVEVYTSKSFAWAAEHFGTEMFAEAEERAQELSGDASTRSISDQLMSIQFCAIERIAGIIAAAKAENEENADAEKEDADVE